MKRILLPMLVAVLGFCSPAAAQTTAERPEQAVITPTAEDTRNALRELLEQYPHSVAEILRRDPSLMSKPDYMAAYPDLVKYLESHPEIPRNVEYYLEGFGAWQNSRQLDPSFEALGILLGGFAVGFVMILFSAIITWLVRAFIQHRRWLKASTVQAEFHTKLLDRLSTNEELIAYVQSPAGRRFLEAAPVRADADGPGFSAPIGSIVWSMMAGVVLSVLGGGVRYAGKFVVDDAQNAIVVAGVIILSLGLGFIFAALMAFAVSARLGLFPARSTAESQSTNA
ncbi:MAG: hypothetical protein ACKOEC_10640 [Acidimicrobiia bacterium]